ncbi:MAG TPA: nucleotidyltransferase domain-containing protein [Phycisphaerae bacterium]|nr:nucleotidyltransferase domain-containing protein [Phycisphaerae bacterium]
MAMVSRETIRKAVDVLRLTASPRKIILFGSYAAGAARDDSDLDLLVVEDQVEDIPAEMVRLMRALSPLRIPAEVVVIRTSDFDEWSTVPGTVYWDAARTGEVLFDAA